MRKLSNHGLYIYLLTKKGWKVEIKNVNKLSYFTMPLPITLCCSCGFAELCRKWRCRTMFSTGDAVIRWHNISDVFFNIARWGRAGLILTSTIKMLLFITSPFNKALEHQYRQQWLASSLQRIIMCLAYCHHPILLLWWKCRWILRSLSTPSRSPLIK